MTRLLRLVDVCVIVMANLLTFVVIPSNASSAILIPNVWRIPRDTVAKTRILLPGSPHRDPQMLRVSRSIQQYLKSFAPPTATSEEKNNGDSVESSERLLIAQSAGGFPREFFRSLLKRLDERSHDAATTRYRRIALPARDQQQFRRQQRSVGALSTPSTPSILMRVTTADLLKLRPYSNHRAIKFNIPRKRSQPAPEDDYSLLDFNFEPINPINLVN